jgi:ComF family protein
VKGVVKNMVSPVEKVISLLTPANCMICSIEGKELCSGCFLTSIPSVTPRCYICNKLMVDSAVCLSCRSRSRLRRVWSLGLYKEELKQLIWSIKYQRNRSAARMLGQYLAEKIQFLPAGTIVVPVPTATNRVRMRGFDQSLVLAEAFARARKLPFRLVFRRINQIEQIGKRRSERMKQMQDSLILTNENVIKDKNILLIDDVLTTGATLEAASALLRDSGAKHVDAAVIARRLLQ